MVALLVPGAFRYMLGLHSIWLINSAAHMGTEKPYDPRLMPAEVPFVSFMSGGEGWHNWHHAYPYDWVSAESLVQYNPSGWFIYLCLTTGLAFNGKRATGIWMNKKKMQAKAGKASKKLE